MAHVRGLLAGLTLGLGLTALAAPLGHAEPQATHLNPDRVPGFEQAQNWLRIAQRTRSAA
jgi:hypothetical protein